VRRLVGFAQQPVGIGAGALPHRDVDAGRHLLRQALDDERLAEARHHPLGHLLRLGHVEQPGQPGQPGQHGRDLLTPQPSDNQASRACGRTVMAPSGS
jgi:hypothetical protein